jgi:WD40 repeat protein/serine/threonine protein kinase
MAHVWAMNQHAMTPGQPEQSVFGEAILLATPEARAAFLDAACGTDSALRQRVESLLRAAESPGNFLEAPPTGLSGDADATLHGREFSEGPGDKIGRYKLLEQIGEGGCGVVYLAEQLEPVRRRVALKVIKLGMNTKSVVARFEAERQALALMDHPNIAKVLDGGATQTGRLYFVMELVRGVRITDFCDEARLPIQERLRLFVQVCQAVQHAHQKGIIHRDLKPSNILVTVNDGVPVPKVIDFGIAKATGQQLTDKTLFTQFHAFIGTPAYVSPEQAQMSSVDVDTRSDIYSLGVLLYELLTGCTPFDGRELLRSGLDEMRRVIQNVEPPRPSTRLSTLGLAEATALSGKRQTTVPELSGGARGDLDCIVMKCLEKDRSRRYETAIGLAADIERHLRNEPVCARPPSVAYRLQKAWRRNKVVLVAAAAVLAALIVGITVSTSQAVRASKAGRQQMILRQAAQTERDHAREAQRLAERERARADLQRTIAERNSYIANMNLAQQAWEQNHLGRVRQLLEETATYPHRGFEWYYWQRQIHLDLLTLRGHRGQVSCVAFSPDGQKIVTGSSDQTAKVWDAVRGTELLTLKGHTGNVVSVAFSPDGRRIFTGGADQKARIWEATTGQEILTLNGQTNLAKSVAFSPDGQRIVTGGSDGMARVWEAASGKQVFTLHAHNAPIESVAFSPDGRRLVTGGDDLAKIWDTGTGQELLTLSGHGSWVTAVAFSPDGQRIITGSHDKTAKVWDTTSGIQLLTLEAHTGYVVSVAFSPDGQRLITSSADRTAKVWEAADGQEIVTLKGHASFVTSAAFAPDNQRIVTGSADNTAKVWSAVDVMESLAGDAWITSVAVSPDGQRIATGSADQTAQVWDTGTGEQLLTLHGHGGWLTSVAFSPDGQRIVTGSGDKTAKLWDTASGKELLTLRGHSNDVSSVAFSPDGRQILTGSGDQTAKVWDAAHGNELLTLKGHKDKIHSVAFSPDGQRIVTGSSDNTARVWEAFTGKELLVLQGHGRSIHSVAFSPDGQRIATGSWDETVKVWAAANGQELFTLKGQSALINSVAFSADGQRIVTGSIDRTVKVWEATLGQELLTLKGHTHYVLAAVFSPNGQRIVTGSADNTARVWQGATPEQVLYWQQEEQTAAGSSRAAGRYETTPGTLKQPQPSK